QSDDDKAAEHGVPEPTAGFTWRGWPIGKQIRVYLRRPAVQDVPEDQKQRHDRERLAQGEYPGHDPVAPLGPALLNVEERRGRWWRRLGRGCDQVPAPARLARELDEVPPGHVCQGRNEKEDEPEGDERRPHFIVGLVELAGDDAGDRVAAGSHREVQ